MLEVYEVEPEERPLLEQACRTADELDRVSEALREASVTTQGSAGQVTAHPLLAEARNHRATLQKLLDALELPGEGDGQESATSLRARRAARARWDNRGGHVA